MTKPAIIFLALVFAGALVLGAASGVAAQPEATISGTLINGTPDAQIPFQSMVTLTVFSGETPVFQDQATTDEQGFFQFNQVPVGEALRYVVSAQYQGVPYQTDVDIASEGPIELTIFETLTDPSVIKVLDDTVMITPSREGAGQLVFRQVVRVKNSSQRTFVPSFGEGDTGVMSFLRVSLPFGFEELNLTSDMIGGQVIPIDLGVGITTPVPPGIHAVVLTYLVPYEGTSLVYEPLFPFGAQTLLVLMREDVGTVVGTELREIEPITTGGNTFRAFQRINIEPGSRVTLGLSNLPEESWAARLWDAINSRWEASLIVPGLTGLVLIGVIVYAWKLKKRQTGWSTPALVSEDALGQPAQRRWLDAIAALDESYERGEITQEEYKAHREEMKHNLLRLVIKGAG